VSEQEETAERKSARIRLYQAQQEAARRKFARAEELALMALEIDESFVEARLWLAKLYEDNDETRKAAHMYETVLHEDKENEEAWKGLERVAPAAAQRLRRLSEIAPDPFVARRQQTTLSDDIVDMETLAEERSGAGAGPSFGVFGEFSEEIAGELGEEEAGGEQEEGPQRGPAEWEYEQDRPVLAKWRAAGPVAQMVAAIRAAWQRPEVFNPVEEMCAHGSASSYEDMLSAVEQASARLGLEKPDIYMLPEPIMDPVVIRDGPPTIAIPTGMVRAMQRPEQTFQIARRLFLIRADYLAEWQAADIVLARRTRVMGDCLSTLREVLEGIAGNWRNGLDQGRIEQLKKLAHAWQQRVALSADRAGLVACRDLQAACQAIVKGTARSANEKVAATVREFMDRFRGQEAAALAAIPPQASPDSDEAYAAYRIMMLRWWASTDQGKQWLAGGTT